MTGPTDTPREPPPGWEQAAPVSPLEREKLERQLEVGYLKRERDAAVAEAERIAGLLGEADIDRARLERERDEALELRDVMAKQRTAMTNECDDVMTQLHDSEVDAARLRETLLEAETHIRSLLAHHDLAMRHETTIATTLPNAEKWLDDRS